TQTLLRTSYETPERGPCVPLRCSTVGTSVDPMVATSLPSLSRWLLRTIRLGYVTQFARHTPKFRDVHFTSVEAADAPVLSAEIATLLAKDAIQPAPPADMKAGFYSPYFIVPMKGGGLPFLDLRATIQDAHAEAHLQVCPNRTEGRTFMLQYFRATDHFLRFTFEGWACQHQVLPFGLSLSPCVSTEVTEAALVPLRDQGIRTLNYLDDWLILAQSQDQLCEHRDLVLASYETASTLAPRPSPEVGVAARHSPGQSDTGLPPNLHPVTGVPLEQVSRHAVAHTDASTTGWGATYNGQAVYTGISCLDLLAVHLALNLLKGCLQGKLVLVRMDNIATVVYINKQGGLRSCC
ncbi:hypothetical protein M9458_017043, partial [Cirrhinus mrigala]